MDMNDLLSAFGNIALDNHDALCSTFVRVLQTDANVARFFLESSNWDVAMAVVAFLEAMPNRETLQANMQGIPRCTLLSDFSQVSSTLWRPGAPIPMQWKFGNSGSAPWPPSAQLIFIEGDQLGGPKAVPLHPLPPGTETALEITLRAPISAKSVANNRAQAAAAAAAAQIGAAAAAPPQPPCACAYCGCWRVTCATGFMSDAIWVVINVDEAAPIVMTQQQLMQQHVFGSQPPAQLAAGMQALGLGLAGHPSAPPPPAATIGAAAAAAGDPDDDEML